MRTPAARLRATIMAGQIAVACVLLIGAGLLGRSLQSLINVDRGYDPSNLLTARLPLPSDANLRDERRHAASHLRSAAGAPWRHARVIRQRLAARLRRRAERVHYPVAARSLHDSRRFRRSHRTVAPEYLTAMGLRLRAGRLLADSDTETSQPVLVVNRSFADQYLGDDPIGRRLSLSLYRQGRMGDHRRGRRHEAGRTGDGGVRQHRRRWRSRRCSRRTASSARCGPTASSSSRAPPAILPRSRQPCERSSASRRRRYVLDSVMTMEDRLMSSLSRPRAYALVLAGVATFALAIAVIGLFGVVSYSVAQRSREIGVRTALGAQTVDVVGPRAAVGNDHHRRGSDGGACGARLRAGGATARSRRSFQRRRKRVRGPGTNSPA